MKVDVNVRMVDDNTAFIARFDDERSIKLTIMELLAIIGALENIKKDMMLENGQEIEDGSVLDSIEGIKLSSKSKD